MKQLFLHLTSFVADGKLLGSKTSSYGIDVTISFASDTSKSVSR